MKTIEIAGGGLAGLSLGIALRSRAVPVRVCEATSYPRHRVCGEFVNGVTRETLARLKVGEIFEDALQHRKTRWFMGGRKILEAELERPALGMSRWVMDERLRARFEELGGELRCQTRVPRVAREGLVWTAGRQLDRESELIGLKGHFEGLEVGGALEMHIGDGCYVGLTPVSADGSRVNVCGLFRRTKLGAGRDAMLGNLEEGGLRILARRMKGARMVEGSLTGITGIELGRQTAEVGELCTLGDAERMIPPFTGNGMSMAFESAECAMEPLLDYSAGDLGWDEARGRIAMALDERFRERVELGVMLHRCLTNWLGRITLEAAASSGLLPFGALHRRLT